ncbi:MAG: ABC transporter ATPase [Calditrichaeota bacterium]|nr:ABC transporter ATPase [Calditrichota bacterium]
MVLESSPGTSRVWVYGFNLLLSPEQKAIVQSKLEEFKSGWQYHGKAVNGDFEIIHDQFVLLTTNDSISGCSIDSSVAVFKELKLIHGLDALDQNLIFFRSKRGVEAVSRPEFQVLVTAGEINENTKVFNLSVSSINEVREGKFEVNFKNSWHSQAFKLKPETVS